MVDERANTFIEACIKAGYDISTTSPSEYKDLERLQKWLKNNFGVNYFSFLTKEAQWSAIDKMRKEINDQG